MPVWHEATKELQESGELRVIGIVQEQHPDRSLLFHQWKEFPWPVLWDPFNLLEVTAVPLAYGVDEHGVVRGMNYSPKKIHEEGGFVESFLRKEFPAPEGEGGAAHPVSPAALEGPAPEPHTVAARDRALASLLFTATPDAPFEAALAELAFHSAAEDADASHLFRHGVAHRLRLDHAGGPATDFQASLDLWTRALAARPGQYIWRRRIQQWGPRLDKPYPFYDWVKQATEEITARGEEPPIPLAVSLTGSEIAGQTRSLPKAPENEVEPDPDAGVPVDEAGLVTVESAVALHAGFASKRVRVPPGTARVHLALRPTAEGAHWSGDAGPQEVWLELPEGWSVNQRRWTLPVPAVESSTEPLRFDFELSAPMGPPGAATLRGYALYYVCAADGTCSYLRQEIEVDLPMPPAAGR